jgi:hypothetical protein
MPASRSPSKKTVQRRVGADPRRGNREEAHRRRTPPHHTPHFNTTVGISRDWVEKQGRRRVGAQHWAQLIKVATFTGGGSTCGGFSNPVRARVSHSSPPKSLPNHPQGATRSRALEKQRGFHFPRARRRRGFALSEAGWEMDKGHQTRAL